MKVLLVGALLAATSAFAVIENGGGREPSWTDILPKADFVGVVECITAGDSAGRYVVLESWKGAPTDSEITLREDAVNNDSRIALVGDRFLIAAVKNEAGRSTDRPRIAGEFPPQWAELPADYEVPQWGIKLPLPEQTGQLPPFSAKMDWWNSEDGILHSGFKRWYPFRSYALSIIRSKPQDRELAALKAQAVGQLYLQHPISNFSTTESKVAAQERQLTAASSVEDFLRRSLSMSSSTSAPALPLNTILSKGGGEITLRLLKADASPLGAFSAAEKEWFARAIQRRLDVWKIPPSESLSIKSDEAPVKSLLPAYNESADWSRAFVQLSSRDPSAVAAFLSELRSTKPPLPPSVRFALAANFAAVCDRDRKNNLHTLAASADPYVKVVGAEYLATEDAEAGIHALLESANLDGDPGTLAALALARRGRREFVPRALAALQPGDSNSNEIFHHWLQLKTRAFLSNSASASKMTAPDWNSIEPWWTSRADRIILSDPWRAELNKRKLD